MVGQIKIPFQGGNYQDEDKIVVLADGKVAEQGSPTELRKKEDGIFKRIAKLQSESAEWSIA